MTCVLVFGAGRIGMPVVSRLVDAGYTVHVVDLEAGLRRDVESAGARWITDRAERDQALQACEVLLTVLPGSAELDQLMQGRSDIGVRGVLGSLSPDTLWIDMTSTAPDIARDLVVAAEAAGVCYVDAAIGGGAEAATYGELTFFVGGESEDVARAVPLLECLAEPAGIHRMGGHGSGYLSKLLVNQVWLAQAVALGEAFGLARRSGLDTAKVADVLAASPAASTLIDDYLPRILRGDYAVDFGIDRLVEELDAVEREAVAAAVPWTVSHAVADVHRAALAHYGPTDGELLAVAYIEHLSRGEARPAPTPDTDADGRAIDVQPG